MSTDQLERLVHSWAVASDVEEIKETWLSELRGQGIGNIQAPVGHCRVLQTLGRKHWNISVDCFGLN